MKTLVVYYSRSGNTELVARRRAEETGADVLWLDTVDDFYGMNGFVNALKATFRKKPMLLFPYDTDVSSYDKVIICTPVWGGSISLPMLEFCRRERHNIMAADYVFVHAMPKFDAEKAAAELDRLLRLEHGSAEAVRSVLKKQIEKKDE